MSEILKVKLTDTHTLIAYGRHRMVQESVGTSRGKSEHNVVFKVGPMDGEVFIDCSPEAGALLLAMLARRDE